MELSLAELRNLKIDLDANLHALKLSDASGNVANIVDRSSVYPVIFPRSRHSRNRTATSLGSSV